MILDVFCQSRIPNPGVKKAPDPGSATLILVSAKASCEKNYSKIITHLSGHEVGELLDRCGQVEPGEARHQPAHPPGQATQHHQVLERFLPNILGETFQLNYFTVLRIHDIWCISGSGSGSADPCL
jgi:hypothetical protein